jgi:hypothetical protein
MVTGFDREVTAMVKSDGSVSLPLAGAVRAEGLTRIFPRND